VVQEDLKRLSLKGNKGREGDFTSEAILRALVVHAVAGGSLRVTVRYLATPRMRLEGIENFISLCSHLLAQ
jgi:hypothetical protein